jgi:hypothetical protein
MEISIMTVKLVTYDLNQPGQKHANVLAEIRKLNYKKLSESSYAVDTFLTPDQLFDLFGPLIDENDRVAIITLSKPFQGWLNKETIGWLENNL